MHGYANEVSKTRSTTAMKLIVLLAVFLFTGACSRANPTSDFQAGVTEITKEYIEAWGRQDSRGVANCFAEDGMVMAPGRDVLQGRKEIGEFMETMMMMGVVGIRAEDKELEIFDDGQVGYSRGYYTYLDKDGTVIDYGKYVIIGKMIDGKVKIHISIFNSNSNTPQPRDEL